MDRCESRHNGGVPGFVKAFGGVSAEEIQAGDARPIEDLSDQSPCDAATAVLRRYDELGEVSRQAVTERMGETNDFAVGT